VPLTFDLLASRQQPMCQLSVLTVEASTRTDIRARLFWRQQRLGKRQKHEQTGIQVIHFPQRGA